MEKILRAVSTVVLLGILAVLILIYLRLPQAQHFPTLKDVREAVGDQKQGLLMEMPMVRVQGTVSVDVTNSSLDVSVENTPLEVEISR